MLGFTVPHPGDSSVYRMKLRINVSVYTMLASMKNTWKLRKHIFQTYIHGNELFSDSPTGLIFPIILQRVTSVAPFLFSIYGCLFVLSKITFSPMYSECLPSPKLPIFHCRNTIPNFPEFRGPKTTQLTKIRPAENVGFQDSLKIKLKKLWTFQCPLKLFEIIPILFDSYACILFLFFGFSFDDC